MNKVIVNGAYGKMGKITTETIAAAPDFSLVAAIGRDDQLAKVIKATQANIVIDFTTPDVVFENTKIIIEQKAHPIIGTSGLSVTEIEELKKRCNDQTLGGIIAPNFALGCILLMKYAKDAIQYLPDAEIIEMHHEKKVDAPSGTAVKTAQMMNDARHNKSVAPQPPIDANSTPSSAYGNRQHGVPIHSVRLPGLFAHQTVIFGGLGETLTIRQDSLTRESMMPGVLLSCRKVTSLNHLVYGLENIID